MKSGLEEFLKRIESKPTNETLIDRFMTLVLEEEGVDRILYLKKLVNLLLKGNPYAALKAAYVELQEARKEKLTSEYEIGALKDVESCFIALGKTDNASLVREEIQKLQSEGKGTPPPALARKAKAPVEPLEFPQGVDEGTVEAPRDRTMVAPIPEKPAKKAETAPEKPAAPDASDAFAFKAPPPKLSPQTPVPEAKPAAAPPLEKMAEALAPKPAAQAPAPQAVEAKAAQVEARAIPKAAPVPAPKAAEPTPEVQKAPAKAKAAAPVAPALETLQTQASPQVEIPLAATPKAKAKSSAQAPAPKRAIELESEAPAPAIALAPNAFAMNDIVDEPSDVALTPTPATQAPFPSPASSVFSAQMGDDDNEIQAAEIKPVQPTFLQLGETPDAPAADEDDDALGFVAEYTKGTHGGTAASPDGEAPQGGSFLLEGDVDDLMYSGGSFKSSPPPTNEDTGSELPSSERTMMISLDKVQEVNAQLDLVEGSSSVPDLAYPHNVGLSEEYPSDSDVEPPVFKQEDTAPDLVPAAALEDIGSGFAPSFALGEPSEVSTVEAPADEEPEAPAFALGEESVAESFEAPQAESFVAPQTESGVMALPPEDFEPNFMPNFEIAVTSAAEAPSPVVQVTMEEEPAPEPTPPQIAEAPAPVLRTATDFDLGPSAFVSAAPETEEPEAVLFEPRAVVWDEEEAAPEPVQPKRAVREVEGSAEWRVVQDRLRMMSGIELSRAHGLDFVKKLLREKEDSLRVEKALSRLLQFLETPLKASSSSAISSWIFEELDPNEMHALWETLNLGEEALDLFLAHLDELESRQAWRRSLSTLRGVLHFELNSAWYKRSYPYLQRAWEQLGLEGWPWVVDEGGVAFRERLSRREEPLLFTLLA